MKLKKYYYFKNNFQIKIYFNVFLKKQINKQTNKQINKQMRSNYILILLFFISYTKSEETCCFPFFTDSECIDNKIPNSFCYPLNKYLGNKCFDCNQVDPLIRRLLSIHNPPNKDIEISKDIEDCDLNKDETYNEKSNEEIISSIKKFQTIK